MKLLLILSFFTTQWAYAMKDDTATAIQMCLDLEKEIKSLDKQAFESLEEGLKNHPDLYTKMLELVSIYSKKEEEKGCLLTEEDENDFPLRAFVILSEIGINVEIYRMITSVAVTALINSSSSPIKNVRQNMESLEQEFDKIEEEQASLYDRYHNHSCCNKVVPTR